MKRETRPTESERERERERVGKQEKSCNSETELADESVGGWRRLSGIKGRSNREREREREEQRGEPKGERQKGVETETREKEGRLRTREGTPLAAFYIDIFMGVRRVSRCLESTLPPSLPPTTSPPCTPKLAPPPPPPATLRHSFNRSLSELPLRYRLFSIT